MLSLWVTIVIIISLIVILMKRAHGLKTSPSTNNNKLEKPPNNTQ
ncbi:hypothetical protein [Ornithinibacillus californiensis]|nr:hypothetical protein [Ornithinibacillus californiensis]